jgi:hypothetical protein
MLKVLLAALLVPGLLFAQGEETKDHWAPFEFFIGEWGGIGESKAGTSKIEAEYGYVLGGRFLEVRHHSEFEPTEENPEGEIHDDLGYISYDSIRDKFVLRQFHVEGFVNQYVLDSVSADGRLMIFESEAIENLPAGWRVRLTHEITGKDEYRATFDLAAPDKDFICYFQNRFRRKGGQ